MDLIKDKITQKWTNADHFASIDAAIDYYEDIMRNTTIVLLWLLLPILGIFIAFWLLGNAIRENKCIELKINYLYQKKLLEDKKKS